MRVSLYRSLLNITRYIVVCESVIKEVDCCSICENKKILAWSPFKINKLSFLFFFSFFFFFFSQENIRLPLYLVRNTKYWRTVYNTFWDTEFNHYYKKILKWSLYYVISMAGSVSLSSTTHFLLHSLLATYRALCNILFDTSGQIFFFFFFFFSFMGRRNKR